MSIDWIHFTPYASLAGGAPDGPPSVPKVAKSTKLPKKNKSRLPRRLKKAQQRSSAQERR